MTDRNPKLSVIIPTTQETETPYFAKTLQSLAQFQDVEVICISIAEAKTRAERLNLGFHRAKGSMILFHHPRSFVEPNGIDYLIKNSEKQIWGGFTHVFDKTHLLLRFTSWYSNKIRGKLKGIIYLDHCVFFQRSLWKENIPAIEIFEDTLLSQNLKIKSWPVILPYYSTTSAIRFEKNGIFLQAFMNQILKMGFILKVPFGIMNKIYERGLNLNGKKS